MDTNRRIGTVMVAAIVAASSVACSGMSDSIWTQSKSVEIDSADLHGCVSRAVKLVPGVLVDESLSSDANVALKLSFDQQKEPLGANIQRRQGNTVEVIFSGRGGAEPEGLRRQITPVLDKIASAIIQSCNGT